MKSVFKIIIAGLISVVSITAQAGLISSENLIENGSFEDNDIRANSWRWFYSSDINGWNGSTIEIWDNFQRFQAFDGSQYIELNAHANRGNQFSIFQSFNTEIGATYELSFAYSARRNKREAFEIGLLSGGLSNQDMLYKELIDDHVVKQWSEYSHTFTATAELTSLRFTSIFPIKGTVGNFIDNVSITQQTPAQAQRIVAVSEPATIGVLLFGLLGMIVRRK